MAPTRSSRPWLALLAGLVIVLAALGLLWWQDGPDDSGSTVAPISRPSADDGSTDLSGLADGSDRRPTAQPERIESARESESAEDAGREELGETLTVFGWVEDGTKRRLADIEINLFDDLGEYLDSTFTDEVGQFAFAWDEPLAAGWSVATEPDPLVDTDLPGANAPAVYVHPKAQKPGDQAVQCTLVLAPAPRIDGIVFDAETRAPMELADIEAVSMTSGWVDEFQDTFTEEDGTFTLGLVDIPPTGVLLRVTDEYDRVSVIGPLDLAPGEVRYIEVPMHDLLALSGTVLSARDAAPIDGAEVTLLPIHVAFEDGENWDITWDDGTWELLDVEVPPDRVWLYFEADDHGPAMVKVEDPYRPVVVELGGYVTLSGRVLEKGSGDPVEDAELRFLLSGPGGALEDYEDLAYSEADGYYSLEFEMVPPTHAELLIETGEHVRFRALLSDLVSTELGWREYQLDIELDPTPET